MIDEKYYMTLEGLRVFVDSVECEICPFYNKICDSKNSTICDIMFDGIYEIEEKINMEG